MRAGKLLAGEAFGVESFTGDVEPRRKKTLRLLGAQTLVPQKVLVFRDPEHFLGREMIPAVRTGDPVEQTAAPALAVRADHSSSALEPILNAKSRI
jgi:hypothetical protein